MSDFMSDIGSLYGTHKVGDTEITIKKKGSNMDLDMTDFITLMITQMTNQGIDDSMDTSEMLNQMVQMQMIQSMVNMTDAVTMNYAASLVDKEVTVGKLEEGKLQEVVGTVTATGTMDGQPVIFVDDKYYYLSDIMAVGRLPEPSEEEDDDKVDGDKPTDPTKPGETEKPDETDKPTDPTKPGETEKPDETDKPTEPVEPGGGTESPDNGENGAPTEGEG